MTTTETTPARDSGTDNLRPQIPTLPEWIAQKLRSQDIVDGRLLETKAEAHGTDVVIDIEHPFPPTSHIRVVAHLEFEVLVDVVEVGASV